MGGTNNIMYYLYMFVSVFFGNINSIKFVIIKDEKRIYGYIYIIIYMPACPISSKAKPDYNVLVRQTYSIIITFR